MESKITLLDANGIEVGETYSRRARQLVKQQRAIWADDTHTAIKFMPDAVEDWELPVSDYAAPPTPPSAKKAEKDSALYILAEKRIRDRRRFVWHTLLFIPGFFGILFFWMAFTGGRMFEGHFFMMGVTMGAWGMSYFSHARAFSKTYGYLIYSDKGDVRHKLRVQAEIDRLRRMGYPD